jgi:hypothetical protein
MEIKGRNFFKLLGETLLSLPRISWNSEINLITTSGHTIFYSDRKANVENMGIM